LKLKLTLITVLLAVASMAHAQGVVSNLSIGAGFEGIFPASTLNKAPYLGGGYPTTQSTTNSIGAIGDIRYDFGRHSALGAAITVNRNTEYFADTYGYVSKVQSNNMEMIGTYIFRLPSNERVKPFAMFGGGMIRFSPNNDNNVGGVPAAVTKPAFAYGFGTDFKLSDHWSVRLQYRGLLRSSPDFKLSSSDPTNTFGTNLRAHVPEPSIQAVYHF
jgi:opacity protein-like surface antigen